jgi:hypothetical protein
MGDEELNFTKEEAQCWADDPRNQAPKSGPLAGIIVACVLLLIALVVVIAASSSGRSRSNGSQIHVGVLFVQ